MKKGPRSGTISGAFFPKKTKKGGSQKRAKKRPFSAAFWGPLKSSKIDHDLHKRHTRSNMLGGVGTGYMCYGGVLFQNPHKGSQNDLKIDDFFTIFAHFFVVFYNSFWLQTEVPATMLNPKALGKAFDYMEVLK